MSVYALLKIRNRAFICLSVGGLLVCIVFLVQGFRCLPTVDLTSSTPPGIVDNEQDNLQQKQLSEWEARLLFAERELKRRYPYFDGAVVRHSASHDLPIIYVITPTYTRPVQKAELTRLANTLLHIQSLHWIVVEDASNRSMLVERLLQRSGLVYTHLHASTPLTLKHNTTDPWWSKPRGVLQRNAGLQWVRNHLSSHYQRNGNGSIGVIYFADDDNTYDLRLFEEMRYTKKVSVWPVGLVGKLRYESPLLSERTGLVVGWFTAFKRSRLYATDMAGFSINARLILENPTVEFNSSIPRGELESNFLRQLIFGLSELEPRANNCTEILVWHTRTEPANLKNEVKLTRMGLAASDPHVEV